MLHAILDVKHVQEPPSVYFIPLIAPRPLFPWYWPTLPMDFSPYPWIFLHETSNRIDEYVQRSMDGDYRRVTCNMYTPLSPVTNGLVWWTRQVRRSNRHERYSREFQTGVFFTFRKLGNAEKCSGNLFPAPSLSNERYSAFPNDPHWWMGIFRELGQWIVDFVSNTNVNLATPVT